MTREEVIKQIKAERDIPVIVVSAKDSVDSKIELLRLGADDYLTKPFDIKELEVRVEVRLRRYREAHTADAAQGAAGSDTDVITFKELKMNPACFSLKVNDIPVELTKHEFRILELLVKNPARAFTKQSIYEYVWDDSYLGEDKTINVHISNIRKKLKAVTTTDYIETVWGIGFKLNTK